MSDNPQIRDVLAYVEAREAELDEQAGQLRVSIEDLTARLGELDAETENLHITRNALLNIPAPEPAEGGEVTCGPFRRRHGTHRRSRYRGIVTAYGRQPALSSPRPSQSRVLCTPGRTKK